MRTIHAFLAILEHCLIFGQFIKEIPEIGKNRATYPHVINNKSKNILDIDLRVFFKDAQVNSAYSQQKRAPAGPSKIIYNLFSLGVGGIPLPPVSYG